MWRPFVAYLLCYVRTMVPIPDAVRSAIMFAQQTLGNERTARLQLEEVESGEFNGKDAWLVTLSMPATVFCPSCSVGLTPG